MIKGRGGGLCNLQQAVAPPTEIDAAIETDNRKSSRRREDGKMLGDLADVIKKLRADPEGVERCSEGFSQKEDR